MAMDGSRAGATNEDADDCSNLLANNARRPRSGYGSPGRLGAVAVSVLVGMLLAALVAHRRFVPGLPATWRGASDDVADFDFNLGKSFEKLKAKMKGLTGTCLSGTDCNGNMGAVQQSCDETGNCKPLGMNFCCTDPMSKIMTSVNDNGEVTCSCSTTSKTIQGFEHKVMDFKKEEVKLMNKLKALTGQCLSGEAICAGKAMHYSYGDTLYCCPSGYTNMTTIDTGLSLICHCK